ncbi:MAG: alpha/beta hydrolase [Thiotrichales bacterium 32-46-8]|nr:alpha/beta hydrolase [Gammaproteobacteria bacterium]OYX05266.1 MAG: alpha/beta hydrolase [Thiotrichales bacterium 32-46-8]OYZ06994.1 MAG: alpha/beta hydrolase [Thiotrichales bacterium 16-46-22]OZA96110.1 MAG: alpha/beta hydrolase [Thiotrichales bacterium 34-46-19]UCG18131.1 MAG: alpha/beta hydrolase [Thiotrichales bacterium]
MKKLSALLFASLLSVSGLASAEDVKQTYQGKTLNANLVYADGKNYGDNVVLLLHGTLTHNGRSTYADLQNNLAKEGITSLSMNLSLGLSDRRGEYDCATPHTHKHTDAIAEVGVWMDWLKQQGVKKVSVMGHSRGGNQIAWYVSEKDSDAINKVILLAPATGEQQSGKEYQEKYGKPLNSVLKNAKEMVKAGKGKELMKNTDFIYCEKSQVTAEAFVDYYDVKPKFDTPTVLKSIKKPTLVIVGSEDTVVPELPKRLEAIKGQKNVTITTIDGGDHFFVDLANEDVAAAVAKFIK